MPRLAGVEAALTRAEFDKYSAPLLLLHGLWAREWIWNGAISYLAHRGWNSYVLRWSGAAASWEDLVAVAQGAADELRGPIVVGYDVGALAALQLRRARAAVAIAPLPCGPGAAAHPLAGSWRARWARWRGGAILPGEAAARNVFGVSADKLAPEPSRWLADLGRIECEDRRDGAPRLILGGTSDACATPADFAALAERTGAESRLVDGGAHDLPYGAPWQSILDQAHRWLVRRLGDEILLLRGDEDLRDD